ncbi:MAG: hypothetical protein LW688_04235 [Cryomorphaceae bacterium]|jgi:hypothetical protein|nr:hypothetical protein [Cryomorphaceae bacterium]
MAIRKLANVDPNALREMIQKINSLRQEIETIKKKLDTGIVNLNKDGFKDKMYDNLQGVIRRSEGDIKNLLGWLQRHETYLQSQEKILLQYLNSLQIK